MPGVIDNYAFFQDRSILACCADVMFFISEVDAEYRVELFLFHIESKIPARWRGLNLLLILSPFGPCEFGSPPPEILGFD